MAIPDQNKKAPFGPNYRTLKCTTGDFFGMLTGDANLGISIIPVGKAPVKNTAPAVAQTAPPTGRAGIDPQKQQVAFYEAERRKRLGLTA